MIEYEILFFPTVIWFSKMSSLPHDAGGEKGSCERRENWVVQTLRKCVFCACTAHLNQANVAINCFAVLLIMTLQNVLFTAATPIVVASLFIWDAFFDLANSNWRDLLYTVRISFLKSSQRLNDEVIWKVWTKILKKWFSPNGPNCSNQHENLHSFGWFWPTHI